MELKAGQVWARNIDEDPETCSVETLDIAKVDNGGTFTGGFHVIGDSSKFEWRENVPESEILSNKAWKLVGALNLKQVLEAKNNLSKAFWKLVKEFEELKNAPADGMQILFKDGTSVFVKGAEVAQYQDGKMLIGDKGENVLAAFEQSEIRGWMRVCGKDIEE